MQAEAEPVTDSPAHASSSPRLRGIEGLRALAAVAVLVYHVWRFGGGQGAVDLGPFQAIMPHLWHGVTLFFVLSGFLLYRPFAAAALRGTPQPDVRRYAVGRALRVLPVYWLVLLTTVFVLGTALVPDDPRPHTEGRLGPELLLVNLLLLQNYSPATIFTGVGPAWSLGVEAVFYVALPVLTLVIGWALRHGTSGRRSALAAPVALILLGTAGKAAALTVVDWELGVVRSFLVMADLFGLGMLVSVLALEVTDGRLVLPRRWRAGTMSAIAGLVVATLMLDPTNLAPRSIVTLGFNTAIGLACALLLALVVMPRAGRSRLVRALELRPLVGAGLISYPAFLWHEPLLRLLESQGWLANGPAGFAPNVALVGGATVIAAMMTHRLVEKPALRLKGRGAATPVGSKAIGPSWARRRWNTGVACVAALAFAVALASCGGPSGAGDPERATIPPPATQPGPSPTASPEASARPRFRRLPGITTASAFSDLGAEDFGRWEREAPNVRDVDIPSSGDDEPQPALWSPPREDAGQNPPLLVVLHSWSNEYLQHLGIPYARWARRNGWAMIAPNFNGMNATPEATGSDAAVRDVVDAIDYAIEEGEVDRRRVFVVGFSGGGMMSLLMAGRRPDRIAGAVSWVPVHDLVDWYGYNTSRSPSRPYVDQIEASCGGAPNAEPAARQSCERRSPRRWLAAARRARVPVLLGHGLGDDVVRPSAALRAFNQLAEPDDRLDRAEVRAAEENHLPAALRGDVTARTDFGRRDPQVLFARRSAQATLVLFEGEHDMVYHPGLEWMARIAQR